MAKEEYSVDDILESIRGGQQPSQPAVNQQERQGYQLGQPVAGGQVAIVRPGTRPRIPETQDESPRRGRVGLVLGITTAALLVGTGGAAWALWPGNGERPADAQPGNGGGDPEAAAIAPTEVPMPTPSSTPEETLEPTELPEDSATAEPTDSESAEPSDDPSEEPSPSDKPSKKPTKSPTKAPSPQPPIINRTSFLIASVDPTGATSKEVADVLSATPPTILGVTEATPTQFENIPNRLGDSFLTIPASYSQNSKEGKRFITYDSSKLRLVVQGSIKVPGVTATSLKDLSLSTPYGLFREIPTDDEKKQGVKGQLVLFVNLDLIDEERSWVVEKSKGKLSADGKVKRDEQMRLIDSSVRALHAGFEDQTKESILVVLQGSLGIKQSEYQFAGKSQDCYFTRGIGDNELLLETSDAIEAGTDGCAYRDAKASDRRAYVSVEEEVEKVIASTRRSPDGTVRVLLTNVDRTIEQRRKKAS